MPTNDALARAREAVERPSVVFQLNVVDGRSGTASYLCVGHPVRALERHKDITFPSPTGEITFGKERKETKREGKVSTGHSINWL